MNMKYIIIDKNGLELPIVFEGNVLTHDEIYRDNSKIVSAGFCSCDGVDGWICWGTSVSLAKYARAQDAGILNKFLK